MRGELGPQLWKDSGGTGKTVGQEQHSEREDASSVIGSALAWSQVNREEEEINDCVFSAVLA